MGDNMADAILLTAFLLALGCVLGVRGLRRRRFRNAAAPVGAAASVLRDVYAGRGTDGQVAAEFDAAPTTSMALDGADPLESHGVLPSDPARDART
jgi:hypothetical protein